MTNISFILRGGMTTPIAHQDIIRYYESCDEHYSMLWHLDTQKAMHYGYWDKNTRNLKEALANLNEVLAQKAGITAQDTVLDAGCGVGGSSLFLGKTRGCRVEGITLSGKHAQGANDYAQQNGLANHVHFSVRDFTNTRFEPETFDVIWAIESVCHAHEKKEFLAEAHRLLKKGGRLIMADFFRNMPQPNATEHYWLDSWAKTWAVPAYEYHQLFITKAEEVGFSQVTAEDVTPHIRRSANRLYLYFYPGLIWNYILKLFGKHKAEHIENIWSAFFQFHSLNRKYWSYRIVSAVKE